MLYKFLFMLILVAPILCFIYLYNRKNYREVLGFFLLLGGFFFLNSEFFLGERFPWHDTLWSHHTFLKMFHWWLSSGFPVGWNPFMNGGEPFYIYSNLFLWSEFVLVTGLNFFFQFSVDELVNLFICFQFVLYFFFSYLLFSELFPTYAKFVTLAFLMFSGLFEVSLLQFSFSHFLYLPLLFFLGIRFYRTGNLWFFAAGSFVFCIQANHYLPQYTALILAVWVAALLPPMLLKKSVKSSGISTWVFFALSICVLAPVLFVFSELSDYVSPARFGQGLSQTAADINKMDFKIRAEQAYFYPLENYLNLFDVDHILLEFTSYCHGVYFIGWIPCFLAIISILFWFKREVEYKSFFVILGFAVLCAMGPATPFWEYLMQVPYIAIRHGFSFAHIINFLILVLAGYGLVLISRYLRNFERVALVLLWVLTTLPTVTKIKHSSPFSGEMSHLLEVKDDFTYPKSRGLILSRVSVLPFDTVPFFLQQASATAYQPKYVFFQQKPFYDLLNRRGDLVTGPLLTLNAVGRDENLWSGGEVLSFSSDSPNSLSINLDLPDERQLLRRENFHPSWKAFVGGAAVELEAFGPFQAINLPAGQHLVEFKFESWYPAFMILHILAVFFGGLFLGSRMIYLRY